MVVGIDFLALYLKWESARVKKSITGGLLLDRLPVYAHDPIVHLDHVARHANDPFHETLGGEVGAQVRREDAARALAAHGIARHGEDHHISSLRVAQTRKPIVGEGDLDPIDESIDEEVVPDEQ